MISRPLLVLFLAFFAYANWLPNPFLFDDIPIIVNNEWLQWKYVPGFFRSFVHDSGGMFPGYRPLLMTTYTFEKEVFGNTAWAFRFMNILIHTINSFLVFLLAREIHKKINAKSQSAFAFLAALFFFVHPVQSSTISLIWKRSDLLVSLGVFGTLYFAQIKKMWPAYLSMLVALFSKENALILPAVLLLWDFFFWRRESAFRTRFFKLHIVSWGLAAFHAWILFVQKPISLHPYLHKGQDFQLPSLHLDWVTYLMTQVGTLIKYVHTVVSPSNLNVFQYVPAVHSLSDPRFLLGCLLLIGIGVGVFLFRNKQPAIAFGFLWFLLLLLPSSSMIPLTQPFDVDRLYLPLFGIAFVVAAYIPEKFSKIAVVVMILLYVPYNNLRAQDWRTAVSLWTRNVQEEPKDPRAWNALGTAYYKERQYARSRVAYEEALRLEPQYGHAEFNLGLTFFQIHQFSEARKHFLSALNLNFLRPHTLRQLALTEAVAGNRNQAKHYFEHSLKENPADPLTQRAYKAFIKTSP